MSTGPTTRIVKDVVNDYRNKELVDPDYQREYIWDDKKAMHFINRTLAVGHVLGVITTYRLTGGNTNFLQDGRQRVTTLMRAIENPHAYGLSKDQVEHLRSAAVSQQTMEYVSHDEARLDFQHLNDGVGLVTFEKYRGDLERDEKGKWLYSTVREVVRDVSCRMAGKSRSIKDGRKKSGQLNRNSLALFYQYVTGHKEPQIYARSERNLEDQIERRVRAWLDENTEELEAKVEGFIRTLENVNAILEQKTLGLPAKQWDITAVRALYAAYLYCRNAGCHADCFLGIVDWYISQNASRKAWQARFDVDVDGTPNTFRMDQVSLKWLDRVSEFGGPSINPRKRTKQLVARAGYDESHIVPHADGGTDTVSEPAIINRSRGRAPMEVDHG
jgi:hypothetical protein